MEAVSSTEPGTINFDMLPAESALTELDFHWDFPMFPPLPEENLFDRELSCLDHQAPLATVSPKDVMTAPSSSSTTLLATPPEFSLAEFSHRPSPLFQVFSEDEDETNELPMFQELAVEAAAPKKSPAATLPRAASAMPMRQGPISHAHPAPSPAPNPAPRPEPVPAPAASPFAPAMNRQMVTTPASLPQASFALPIPPPARLPNPLVALAMPTATATGSPMVRSASSSSGSVPPLASVSSPGESRIRKRQKLPKKPKELPPIEVDQNDPEAVRRARNTAAARGCRNRRWNRLAESERMCDELEAEVKRIRESEQQWMARALAAEAALADLSPIQTNPLQCPANQPRQ